MMSPLRQILVHLDPSAASARRLAAARQLAQQRGAALTALYAVTPAFIELPYAPEIGPSLAASLVEIDEQRCNEARAAFDRELALPGPAVAWAQTSDVPTAGAFAQQALYADLLVLGQHDPADGSASGVPGDFVENVLIASGRPTIVIPYIGAARRIGDSVAIAWKETAESARAVQAAIPFLQQAERVHVIAWGEEGPARIGGKSLDLKQYLHAHGVEATWHHGGPEPAAVGELLLSRIADLGVDLLVMGCYGHSRAREWVLGGVSRTVLASMTVPVLMSH